MKFKLILFFCLFTIGLKAQQKTFNTFYVTTDLDSLPFFSYDPYAVNQFITDNFKTTSIIKKEAGTKINSLIVNFVIDTNGDIYDIRFQQSQNQNVELEIKRVIEMMPKWKPGYKKGTPTATRIYIPINYIINNNEFGISNASNEMVVGNSKKYRFLKSIIVVTSIAIMYFCFKNR